MHALHISKLQGKVVLAWSGTEMALGGGAMTMAETTPETGVWAQTPLVWEHDSIPFLQLTNLDVTLDGGEVYRVLSQFDDGLGRHGIYLVQLPLAADGRDTEMSSAFRIRQLSEFPTGRVSVNVAREDGPRAILEVQLSVGASVVRLVSGEVYEREADVFEICGPDETLLVQLDGQRPNQSLKPTAVGKPPSAAQLQR